MEIGFRDDKLRDLCEKERVARKKLGDACARKLRSRLADLDAARVVTDLVAGRPHPLNAAHPLAPNRSSNLDSFLKPLLERQRRRPWQRRHRCMVKVS